MDLARMIPILASTIVVVSVLLDVGRVIFAIVEGTAEALKDYKPPGWE